MINAEEAKKQSELNKNVVLTKSTTIDEILRKHVEAAIAESISLGQNFVQVNFRFPKVIQDELRDLGYTITKRETKSLPYGITHTIQW